MTIEELINNDLANIYMKAYKHNLLEELCDYLRKAAKVEQIQNMIGPERVVTFHMSGHKLSDNGLVGFSGMVRYETMTEEQLDRFISKLKIWKAIPFLRFFM
jgi:hypothetical protein